MTVPVEPKPEFRRLTEAQVRAALGDADPQNPVACEVARLIAGYTENLRSHAERLGYMPSAVLRLKPRWPIEAIAMELTADAIRATVGETAADNNTGS